jgi:hypothetical protein
MVEDYAKKETRTKQVASCWFVAWLVFLKLRLTFNGLHGSVYQKKEFLIITE